MPCASASARQRPEAVVAVNGLQSQLPGFDPPLVEDRLFLAVYPDAQAATRIAALARQLRERHGLRGNPIAAERLHVTLHHLGNYAGVPDDVVRMAGAAAARVASASFGIGFDRAASFAARRGKCPFVLLGEDGVQSVTTLQRQIGEAMKASGLARHVEARFTPHLTLLYDELVVAGHDIEPIHWHVREFALVHSLLGRSRHVVLARWPLE